MVAKATIDSSAQSHDVVTDSASQSDQIVDFTQGADKIDRPDSLAGGQLTSANSPGIADRQQAKRGVAMGHMSGCFDMAGRT
jgi:hypothetical protein